MRRSAQKKLTEGLVRSALAGQLPWAPPSYTDPPICPLSDDEIEAIHEASLDVIEKIGIRFLNQEALDILNSRWAKWSISTLRGTASEGRNLWQNVASCPRRGVDVCRWNQRACSI